MSFPKIVHQKRSFGQIRKNPLFRFCQPILDIFGLMLLIIHAALTQQEHLILVRWMGLEPPMKNESKTRPCLNTRV